MREEAAAANKRPRMDKSSAEPSDTPNQQVLLSTLWMHWQAYLDSTEDPENGTPDTDELVEMLQMGCEHKGAISMHDLTPSATCSTKDEQIAVAFYVQAWREPVDLMHVLLSIAAHVLADEAIAEYLNCRQTKVRSPDSNEVMSRAQDLLRQALMWFPANPSTWSMLANWVRMTGEHGPALEIAQMYRHAAQQASILRRACLEILSNSDQNDNDHEEGVPPMPSMIETLLLNQVVGVEYDGPEEEEEEEDININDKKQAKEEDEKNQWSVSSVEGTARFMAAMQFSMAGLHDEAAQDLAYFDVTHRLHANVWNKEKALDKKSKLLVGGVDKEPVVFPSPILPTEVHERMLEIFAPDAPFWLESAYNQRGYYSFFIDRLKKDEQPKDYVQDVIEAFLLPLVEQQMPSNADPIVGYEWWTHTRPLSANLGHNLHFDTDEALLKSRQEVTHPVISSVLYLDGACGKAGPTIVLNQTSDESAPNADMIWRNDPSPNSYLLFPGNLLHGVLPCSVSASSHVDKKKHSSERLRNFVPDYGKYLAPSESALEPADQSHRLSFMVGFWTRRVPDGMEDPNRLYGPCGPMPPSSYSWVDAVQQGYPRDAFPRAVYPPNPSSVPVVSPAWELLSKDKQITEDPLFIPTAIDHRYFVKDSPGCFRRSLFERCDDDDDEEEEEEEEEELEEEEEEDENEAETSN